MTKVIKYKNWHAMIELYSNDMFKVKFLVAKKAFEEILNYGSKNNSENIYTNLFWKETAVLVKDIFLKNYIYQAQKNRI